MFSGGKDSFLSICKLLDRNNIIYLITYDNGCGLNSDNVNHGVKRLINKYGEERVKFLGIYNISGIWRNFFLPFFNLKPSEIIEKYGEITYSQFNCLTCRLSMYLYSIAVCKHFRIGKVSDGAKYSQSFAIELEPMLDRFTKLFKEYQIDLILPVVNLDSDWQIKNELLMHGFIPKVLEPQCLLGVPIQKDDLENEVVQGVISFFDKEILGQCEKLIDMIESTITFDANSTLWM